MYLGTRMQIKEHIRVCLCVCVCVCVRACVFVCPCRMPLTAVGYARVSVVSTALPTSPRSSPWRATSYQAWATYTSAAWCTRICQRLTCCCAQTRYDQLQRTWHSMPLLSCSLQAPHAPCMLSCSLQACFTRTAHRACVCVCVCVQLPHSSNTARLTHQCR